jgi:inosose dehydratase
MYWPLGQGDVDIAAIVDHLSRHQYDGWYTLEQHDPHRGTPGGGPGR